MIKVKVFAKVNISLLVNGTDNDGYHILDSVVASANIADVISVQKSVKDQVVLSSKQSGIANKILGLIANMRAIYGFPNVLVSVENHIPLGAGLGASSADMAGVIIAIDELFDLKLTYEQRVKIADSTGCDTAFMLDGGCGKIINRSTVVDRFCMQERNAVIAVKGFCNTADVFRIYDSLPKTMQAFDNGVVIQALKTNESIDGITSNDLTLASSTINPNITRAIEILGNAYMSGSGSSVFAFDVNEGEIQTLKREGFNVFECKIGNFVTQVIKE
jgi:4-diphosphocytidyl-2-C-methyl-D-erythritol kinase